MQAPGPDHAILAAQAFSAGRYADAARHAAQALRRSPRDARLLFCFGASQMRLGAPGEGLASLLEAARREPANADIQCALANTYKLLDRPDEALASVERALAIDPASESAACVKSFLLRTGGRGDEAMAFFEPIYRAHPGVPRVANEFADLCRMQGRAGEGIEALTPIARRERLTEIERRTTAYRLGALLDEEGRYDEAFEMIALANAGPVRSREVPPEGFLRGWTRENIAAMPVAAKTGVTPVLVVGMPRSGTTLTERIIASHPDAGGVGECQLLPKFLAELVRLGRPPTQGWMDTHARQYLAHLERAAPTARAVVDKLPANDANIGFASRLLPGVKVVRCVRDPRDTCLSCYFQEFSEALDWSRDLRRCARQHKLHDAIMAHWRAVLDLEIYELRYESLVTDPEPAVRGVLGFIGLGFDEACLRFHRSDRHVTTASWAQVSRPVYTSSVGKWERYAAHLGPLLDELGPIPEEA